MLFTFLIRPICAFHCHHAPDWLLARVFRTRCKCSEMLRNAVNALKSKMINIPIPSPGDPQLMAANRG